MQENVKILQIKDNSKVLVAPVFAVFCAECKAKNCFRQKYGFWVNNKLGLNIKVGDFVRIKRSKLVSNLEGIFALLLPIIFCFLSILFAQKCNFFSLLKLKTECACFFCAIIGFLLGVFVDFILGFILSFVFSAHIAEINEYLP